MSLLPENREVLQEFLVGSLFDEADLDEEHGYFGRVARDAKGSKKLHGAFTGGFVAGYKNTVGSEAGWTPINAVSTKDKPFKAKKQTVLDFMDEEDLGQAVVGVNLVTNPNFDTFGEHTKSLFGKVVGDTLFGQSLDSIFVRPKTSIGYQILENLKADEEGKKLVEQEVHRKRIAGPLLPYKEESYIDLSALTKEKSDFHGLGYDPAADLIGLSGEDLMEEVFNKKMKTLFAVVDEAKADPKKNTNRMGFGIIEEEDTFRPEEYNAFEVAADEGNEGLGNLDRFNLASLSQTGSILHSFIQSDLKLPEMSYEKEKVPEDFTPFRRFAENKTQRQNLTPADRAQMLGERTTVGQEETHLSREDQEEERRLAENLLNEKTKKFMEKLSEKSRSMLSHENKFVLSGTKFDSVTESVNYFPNDAQKNSRFKQYILEREGLTPAPVPGLSKITPLTPQEEREFSRMYLVFEERREREELFKTDQDKLLMKIEDLKEKIEQHRRQRVVEDWIPDKVVCIRFGVAQPKKKGALLQEEQDFESKVMPALQKDLKKHRFMGVEMDANVLDKRDPADLEAAEAAPGQAIPVAPRQAGPEAVFMPDENDMQIGRADQDLFDSIFNKR